MKQLNYAALKEAGYKGFLQENAPEKVLQFGEGNFLRAFVDYWFDISNEKAGWNGKCCLVQPIPQGLTQLINAQEGLYTLYLRGTENGEKVDRKRVISSVSRCLNPYEEAGFAAMMEVAVSDALEYIVSNTTEAGIVYDPACNFADKPAASFPGKLTQVLYTRFQAGKGGLVILSCELIDNNGKELLKCVNQYIDQWALEEDFRDYVNLKCTFCSTLVDRIVPGRIRDAAEVARLETENGYSDPLMDVGEVFGVWNIEGPAWLEEKLPFKMNGLVPMPILSMAAAAIGIFVCAIKNKAWGSAIFPIISGWALANAMMTHPILQTGANCQLMQTLGLVTAIVGAVTLVTSLTHYILDLIAYKKAMAK